jgi:hypothetical protein
MGNIATDGTSMPSAEQLKAHVFAPEVIAYLDTPDGRTNGEELNRFIESVSDAYRNVLDWRLRMKTGGAGVATVPGAAVGDACRLTLMNAATELGVPIPDALTTPAGKILLPTTYPNALRALVTAPGAVLGVTAAIGAILALPAFAATTELLKTTVRKVADITTDTMGMIAGQVRVCAGECACACECVCVSASVSASVRVSVRVRVHVCGCVCRSPSGASSGASSKASLRCLPPPRRRAITSRR